MAKTKWHDYTPALAMKLAAAHQTARTVVDISGRGVLIGLSNTGVSATWSLQVDGGTIYEVQSTAGGGFNPGMFVPFRTSLKVMCSSTATSNRAVYALS